MLVTLLFDDWFPVENKRHDGHQLETCQCKDNEASAGDASEFPSPRSGAMVRVNTSARKFQILG